MGVRWAVELIDGASVRAEILSVPVITEAQLAEVRSLYLYFSIWMILYRTLCVRLNSSNSTAMSRILPTQAEDSKGLRSKECILSRGAGREVGECVASVGRLAPTRHGRDVLI